MRVLRIVLIAVILILPRIALGQHVALHWYALQSLLPLTAEEGKEALVLIREHTSDSLSTFADKNDYFSFATHDEENLNLLVDHLNASGYYLIDVTNPRVENQYYVRSTKGYQYAVLFCLEPTKFADLTVESIVLTNQVWDALPPTYQSLILESSRFYRKED